MGLIDCVPFEESTPNYPEDMHRLIKELPRDAEIIGAVEENPADPPPAR